VTKLFERAGVDYAQWRALVRAFVSIDFDTLKTAQGGLSGRKMAGGVLTFVLVYGLAGFSPALVAWFSRDLLLSATYMTTIVGFMLAASLLVGEGSAIISANDHQVLGFRPVASRTYFAVRVTTVFVRTTIIVTLVSLPAVAVFLLKGGTHVRLALGALAAAYAVGIAVTLAIIAMYGWLLAKAGPARMQRYVVYLQFVASTITWGGLLIASRDLASKAVSGLALSGKPLALLYPGVWFGSFIPLADGQFDVTTIAAAVLSVALIGVLARSITGKVSLEYAENLSRLTTESAPTTTESPSRWLGLLNNETRAVAILVRSQLRHDMKFRIGLVSLIPITFIYMYMGSRDGPPADPFVHGMKGGGGGPGIIQIALMILPLTMRRVLVTSDAFSASWVFHTTPADRAKLVLSSRNIIALFFLFPYLAFLGLVFAWSFHNPLHAAVHAVFLGVMSYLVLQFTVMMSPQLPFSMPHNKDTNAGMNMATMMIVMVVGMGMYFLLIVFVYKSVLAMVLTLAGFGFVGLGMDRVTRRRATSRPVEEVYLSAG
jgi:hypothetical protein